MRPHRTKLVALVGAAALAAPSAAAAQGAVDEQYRDPFAGQDDGGSDTAQPAPGADDAPSTGAPSAAPPPTEPTAATTGELPRTGLPAGVVAAAIALVAAGMTLRRRLH